MGLSEYYAQHNSSGDFLGQLHTPKDLAMEYKYSTIVDPLTYETEALCHGIPLRVHTYPGRADVGALRAQEDWKRFVGPLGHYNGSLGPEYSFMAVSVPECLPERLEIVSYANEFAFLHDITEGLGKTEGDKPLHAPSEAASTGAIGDRDSGEKQMRSKLLSEMLALDKDRALTTMKAWAKFLELTSGRQHHTHFATLDEYLLHRVINVAQMVWLGLMTFGMGITIPEHETDLCAELLRPAWIAEGLAKDLYSWEKDHQEAIRNDQPDFVNAISVLTEEHSISEEQAKLLCREKIKAAITEYLQVIQNSCSNNSLSLDLRKCIEAVQYRLSGNVFWSLQCPRYHPEAQHNQLQPLRIKYGVAVNPGPNLDLKTKREKTPPSAEDSTRPHKRIWNTGLSTPPSPAATPSDSPSALDCCKAHVETDWAAINFDLPPTDTHSRENARTSEDTSILLDLPELGEEVVNAPYEYLTSLPSKGMRDQVIDALNIWFAVPAELVEKIKAIGNRLHSASLMLDDFEDQSPLRRGQPSTHSIFGAAQTVNSANFQIITALDDIQKLNKPACLTIFIEEMRSLYTGQSLDLYWTCNLICPSVAEYLKMVDNKTGGLFRLLSRLMGACSPVAYDRDIDDLTVLIGRLYQVRDDYQNLMSKDYTAQKGFCEDLDEGKYSLPLIHALEQNPQNMQLRSTLVQRRVAGQSSTVHKRFVLQHLARSKSLDFTALVLKRLHAEVIRKIEKIEKRFKTENFPLRLIMGLLSV